MSVRTVPIDSSLTQFYFLLFEILQQNGFVNEFIIFIQKINYSFLSFFNKVFFSLLVQISTLESDISSRIKKREQNPKSLIAQIARTLFKQIENSNRLLVNCSETFTTTRMSSRRNSLLSLLLKLQICNLHAIAKIKKAVDPKKSFYYATTGEEFNILNELSI